MPDRRTHERTATDVPAHRLLSAALLALTLLPGLVTAGELDAVLAWLETPNAADLPPGTVIGQARLDRLAGVLPPPFVARLDFPGVRMAIGATADLAPHAAYREATEQLAGGVTLAADGSLEGYTAGQPFPPAVVAAAPPERAGYMVAWNNRHRWTYYGYRSEEFLMCYMVRGRDTGARPADWGGDGSCERSMTMDFHRVYLRHLAMLPADGYRLDLRDAERFLYKDIMRITDPFDVAGSAFMIERPLAFGEEDQVHSYLPGERRVRRLSARERADAFMGSDFTLDDLEAWSGKIADYDWRYLGTRTVLGVVQSRLDYSHFQGPLSDIADDEWQLRAAHVVMAKPVWDEHPYSARVMFFDRQAHVVLMTLAFNREGRLWKILYPIYAWPEAADPAAPQPHETALMWRSSVALDVLDDKSSVTRSYGTDLPTMEASDVRRLFSASTLTEGR